MKKYLLLVFLLINLFAKAQQVRDNFNPLITLDGAIVRDVAIYPSGKVVVAANVVSVDGKKVGGIARLLVDGKLDESFNTGSGFVGEANRVNLQTDGKIIVTGSFTNYNGISARGIIRLNSDGTVDNTFLTGIGVSGEIRDAEIQPDGKIIIGGNISKYNGIAVNNICRLNNDGSLDNSFVSSLKFNLYYEFIYTISLQIDGKIIIGGSFFNASGHAFLGRLNTDGSIDQTFNPGGVGPDYTVSDISLQMIGQEQYIVISGLGLDKYNNIKTGSVIRIKPDGTRDATFNSSSVFVSTPVVRVFTFFDQVYCVATGASPGLYRLNNNGTKDVTFDRTPYQSSISWAGRTVEGDIFLNGNFNFGSSSFKSDFIKVSSNGSLIGTFDANLSSGGIVSSVIVSGDKFIIGGIFDKVNNTSGASLFKLNNDGTTDNSLVTGTGFKSTSYGHADVSAIAQQSDGKLLVGGSFGEYNGVIANALIRLNANGSKDATFTVGSFSSGPRVDKILIENNSKIIVGGDFTSYQLIPRSNFIRLNSDGTIDPSFNSENVLLNKTFGDCILQPDGKILVGYYSLGNTSFTSVVKRFLNDGSLDGSFEYTTGGRLRNIEIHNGQLYLVLSDYQGDYGKIVKMNLNGVVDNTFITTFGDDDEYASTSITEASFVADNIIVSGIFKKVGTDLNTLNYYNKNNLAQIMKDGTCQPGFDLQYSGAFSEIIPLNSSSFMIAGSLTFVNALQRTGMAIIDILPLDIPAAPSNGSALINDGKINLTWIDNSNNESSFEIQRFDKDKKVFFTQFITGPDVTSYRDETSKVGISYTYRIRAINAFGVSSFTDAAYIVTGSEEVSQKNAILSFPNPTTGIINLSPLVNMHDIKIIDISGNQISFSKIDESRIDISSAAPGFYIVQAKTSDNVIYQRIIKEN